jgi:hypothetical protein
MPSEPSSLQSIGAILVVFALGRRKLSGQRGFERLFEFIHRAL